MNPLSSASIASISSVRRPASRGVEGRSRWFGANPVYGSSKPRSCPPRRSPALAGVPDSVAARTARQAIPLRLLTNLFISSSPVEQVRAALPLEGAYLVLPGACDLVQVGAGIDHRAQPRRARQLVDPVRPLRVVGVVAPLELLVALGLDQHRGRRRHGLEAVHVA